MQPGRNVVFWVGQIVMLSFVFMHIPGGSFIFNIFLGCSVPARATFYPRPWRVGCCDFPTSNGSRPSCARLAPHRMAKAAEGTNPERSWAHVPTSIFHLRFELRSLI